MRAHDHPLFDDPSRPWGPPLPPALIDAAEGLLGLRLPASLTAALSVCNGGPLRRRALPALGGGAPHGLPDLDGLGYSGGIEADAQRRAEWGFPAGCLAIHFDGPRAVMLDYRRCGPTGEPGVVWVNTDEEQAGRPVERALAPTLSALLSALRFAPTRCLIALQDGVDEDEALDRLQRAGAEGPVRRDHEGGRSLSRPGWDSVEPGVARVRLVPNARIDRTLRFPELPGAAWLLESTAAPAHGPALWALAGQLCAAPLALHLPGPSADILA